MVGFIVLLAVIFLAAGAAGAALGPLTTTHSHISYTGTTPTGGGMNMGSSAHQATRPARQRDGGR
jgi:hypothetical protein